MDGIDTEVRLTTGHTLGVCTPVQREIVHRIARTAILASVVAQGVTVGQAYGPVATEMQLNNPVAAGLFPPAATLTSAASRMTSANYPKNPLSLEKIVIPD
jgi:uncharacterized protein YaaW (UPF0174 family)